MELPIIGIDDAGDIRTFSSLSDAQSSVEWQDVNDWELYTADGFKMDLQVAKGSLLESPRVQLKLSTNVASERLRESILQYLESSGHTLRRDKSLRDLVQFLIRLEQK